MTIIAARCRLLLTGAATVAATALLAVPAQATAASTDSGCPDVRMTQPFAPWGDSSDYFLAPDGGFEADGAGWALRGRAAVTAGNEPFAVNAPSDASSLRLPAGSSATTAAFCIGAEHRTMRFFADADASSSLAVDVLYSRDGDKQRTVRLATVRGSDEWAPSDVVPMVVNELAADHGGTLDVRLRFTPHGAGAWTIDDVYVDPFRGRY